MKKRTTVASTRIAPARRRSRLVGRRSSIIGRSAEPHLLADFGHRGLRDRPDPFGALLEDPIDALGIGHELAVALAGLGVVGQHALEEQPLRVDAPRPSVPLALPDLLVVVAEGAMELA